MPSEWNVKFPTDMLWDHAVISHEVAAAQVPLFVTEGRNAFQRQIERREPTFNGKRFPIAGVNRRVGMNPGITGQAKQIDETTMDFFEPGGTLVTVAGPPAVHTYTPIDFSKAVAVGDLMVKPRITWARSGGGSFYIQAPYGEVIEWDINAEDKVEGLIPFTIQLQADYSAVGFTTDKSYLSYVTNDPA